MSGEPEPKRDRVVVDSRTRVPGPTPRVLITNDDGIDSPGIRRLATALAERYDVVVAAPDRDMSGSGTGIGRFDPDTGIDLRVLELDDSGVEAYAISGPPGLAIMAAALGAFGREPDLVVSGVNAGINTGHSIIHSGTVGAVLTGRTFGWRGLAVSLAPSDPWRWDTAVHVACSVAGWILAQKERPYVINLNIPALSLDDVAGARWVDLDLFGYFSVAGADVPGGKLQLEVTGDDAGIDPASDTALCREGYVTLTPLTTIEPAPFPDVPAAELWNPPPNEG